MSRLKMCIRDRSQFDEDMPVYLKNDDGYTYGHIDRDEICLLYTSGLPSAKLVDLEEALRVDVELLLSDEIADLLDGGWVPSGRNRLVPYRYSNVTITTRGICVAGFSGSLYRMATRVGDARTAHMPCR